MKRILSFTAVSLLFLVACGTINQTPVPTEPTQPLTSPEPVDTQPAGSATPEATPADYGPSGFPPDVNPLTGLPVADPALLQRRPLLIKISNLPRSVRPQWGLSLADIVFEYYTEEGTTRFAALFYGSDAEMAGPIRSARFIDVHLIRGYDAVFAFGLAYEKVLDRLYAAEFADRLVIEGSSTPLFRYDPSIMNHLMVNTAELSAYITAKGVGNGRQNLDGMTFQHAVPTGGQPLGDLYIRYSGAIYNHWQYDPATGKYLRFVDTADDPFSGMGEVYIQATDRLNDEPLQFDNVVVIQVLHESYDVEVWDIQLLGSGTAYALRDGQVYELIWQRLAPDAVISLAYPDGTPFPFKPGTTWFEVIGLRSKLDQTDTSWRFTHRMP